MEAGDVIRKHQTVELTQFEIIDALREAAAKKLGLPPGSAMLGGRAATFGKAWDVAGRPDQLLLLETCEVPLWWFVEVKTDAAVSLSP